MALKKRLIEESLEAERSEFICSRYYQRSKERKDYRNGHWKRYIILKDGRLEISMPRIRSGGYESRVIPKYIQRMPEVNETLKRIFLYGASTRLTGEALQPLIGETVSAQTISNITKSLDDEVRKFHTRILEDTYLYLFLDGIVLKVKTGFGSKKKIILVAYGITHYGKRELIDFIVTKHESEKAWEVFLNNIYRRGLKRNNPPINHH
jgi:transposase-like protein